MRAARSSFARVLGLIGLLLCAAATPVSLDDAALDERIRTLREALDGVVASNGRRSARYSVLALSLETGDTLYARDAHAPLAPASNMKILTTAAALHYLGPTSGTDFLLATGPIENGRLRGDLVLYGTGDPGLADRLTGRDSGALSRSPTRCTRLEWRWSRET